MQPRNLTVLLDFRSANAILRLLVCGASQDRLLPTAGVQRASARLSTAARGVSGSPLGNDSFSRCFDPPRGMHSALGVSETRSSSPSVLAMPRGLPLNGFQ